MQGKKQQN